MYDYFFRKTVWEDLNECSFKKTHRNGTDGDSLQPILMECESLQLILMEYESLQPIPMECESLQLILME